MSKTRVSYMMRPRFLACGIGLAALLLSLVGNAHASDSQVVIVNGTVNHCLPYPSCYKPYEIDVRPGETVTWVNEDNRTHTVTAGTPNYGPVGLFDSGPILPMHSFSQFFGTIGRFPYYDKVDMWPSGMVVVSNQNQTRAEIGWLNGSLSVTAKGSGPSQELVVRKQIENTGSTDATSVLFRLRILNTTGFLFYDKIFNGSVPARQNSTVSFAWDAPEPGNYMLNFDADNLAKQENENSEISYDLVTIAKTNSSGLQPIMTNNFNTSKGISAVPEFGQDSAAVMLVSIAPVLAFSLRSKIRRLD